MFDDENLQMAASWIKNSSIEINGVKLEVEMTPDQKYSILKNYFSSRNINHDDKKALLEVALKGDTSDKA